MAYPIQCHAGFPMPLVAGKYEVLGFTAEINDTTADSQIALFDYAGRDFGYLVDVSNIYQTKTLLIDLKNDGAASGAAGCYDYMFPEPIKVRQGLSLAADNIKGGSICVYRR